MMRPIKITRQRDYQQTLRSFLAREEVQAYTMAILSFFALAFFSIFAIRPTLISFFNLRKQIDDSRRVDTQLEAKINALLKAQEEYQKNQGDIELLSAALPIEPQFPELLKKIETIIIEQEATMTAFSTREFTLLNEKKEKAPTPEDLSTVDFSLSIAPEYAKNETVLSRLMNLRRLITLTLLKFSNEGEKDREEIETTLDAEAYYQAVKEAQSE